jgi:hypothetical protein
MPKRIAASKAKCNLYSLKHILPIIEERVVVDEGAPFIFGNSLEIFCRFNFETASLKQLLRAMQRDGYNRQRTIVLATHETGADDEMASEKEQENKEMTEAMTLVYAALRQ